MQHAEFKAIVQQAMDSLPDWVHQALEHIEIRVTDEPGEECEPGEDDLLGLYVGTPLTERSLDDIVTEPDIIYVYRLPHLELELPPDELREEIATTLIHEIAHYFGIDDDHLDEIGWG
ncbi:MAG: metallopeptidase family protein [Lysobacterales bacterium]